MFIGGLLMYKAFEAIMDKGKLTPLEKVKFKEPMRVLVTIVDEAEISEEDWGRLKKWISKQKKDRKFKSYHSAEDAKQHLRRLTK